MAYEMATTVMAPRRPEIVSRSSLQNNPRPYAQLRAAVKHTTGALVQRKNCRGAVRVYAAAVEESVSARQTGLALMLDEGTRKSHSMAENTAFVTGFFKGIAKKDSFARLVAGLYFVYEAMEEAFDSTPNSGVKALDFKALRRLESLKEDMVYYYGENWRENVKPSPATKKYVDKIKTIAAEDPDLLIAHQYTRYLGDLFGGQMMGGMATRSLKLENGKGVKFYSFQDIPDASKFIETWYTEMNALDLSQEVKQAIVDEGNVVFALNIELFSELDGNPFQSVFALAWDALKEKLGSSEKSLSGGDK